MSDQETVERLRTQGLDVETVGSILGDVGHGERTTPAPFVPARLEASPPLPEPGIYFGMSDEEYHALPALSNTGIKKLAASPMIFWASTPWLSEQKRQKVEEAKQAEEKAHHVFGKAYHCRIMEGADAYARRFAIRLDPANFPDALVSTDQIKAAIGTFTETVAVKPKGRGKADFAAQLAALDPTHPALVGGVDDLKTAIATFTEEAAVQPVRKVPDTLPDGTEYMRDAVKADWIAQLLALDPEAEIFASLEAEHERQHEGKTFLYPDQHAELEIAALMIERDPGLHRAFQGGHAEVVLIWYCERTGVPMKARVDYLKIRGMVDLKSIANQRERSIKNAIRFEIAAYKYNMQPAVYFEGADAVRQLVRDHGLDVVFHADQPSVEEAAARCEFARKWASHRLPDDWLWVFQQKGAAPITRGVYFPRGSVLMVTNDIVTAAKKLFREYGEAFGTDPWLDVKPAYTIADEEIPTSATEI